MVLEPVCLSIRYWEDNQTQHISFTELLVPRQESIRPLYIGIRDRRDASRCAFVAESETARRSSVNAPLVRWRLSIPLNDQSEITALCIINWFMHHIQHISFAETTKLGFLCFFKKNFELPGKCPMKLAFLYEPYGYLEKITLVFAPMCIQYIVQIGVFKWKIRKCNNKQAW